MSFSFECSVKFSAHQPPGQILGEVFASDGMDSPPFILVYVFLWWKIGMPSLKYVPEDWRVRSVRGESYPLHV